ncbi:MAG: hypothetical protein CMLOHMNK_01873 [Steroidobacteraceae bacterium]|nr:hypothetical protein [Steroidobacteraceae bacterium]
MALDWADLLGALALLLVIEGLMPFANPAGLKRALARMLELGDRELRIAGFLTMLTGVVLLFLIRS